VLDDVKAPPPVPEDFWKQVLEEEPFEGEHWKDQWEDEDEDAKSLSSHPSLELESRKSTSTTESTSEDVLRGEDELESRRGGDGLVDPLARLDLGQQHVLNDAHSLYEELCTRQYWRPGYVNDAARSSGKEFQVNDPATLGESLPYRDIVLLLTVFCATSL
jgi:gamma-tubulin complex component 5